MSPSAPFAQLEQRLNAAVFRRLSNAVATFYGGQDLAGIFEAPYAHSDLGEAGFASCRPRFKLLTADVPPRVADWFGSYTEPIDPADLELSISGISYRCVAHEPDGSGMSTLVLERVAE